LLGGLQGLAGIVVKGVVQKENHLDAQSQFDEPTTKLMKREWAEPPSDQASEMLRTKVHFDGG
jgi:hypothetical protein